MTEEIKLPEFNAGIAYLYRIDALIKDYHRASMLNQLEITHTILVQLYSELQPRLSKDQKELVQALENQSNNYRSMSMGRHNADLYKMSLTKWFRELNKAQHDNGLVMPNRENARHALRGGR